ncbi:hypothetical protein C7974DRAFT_380839 [Boeremia exigua]|uniref:uncharacterized protein n=1 Tax=Boeremia exigua TaxID=749465 RepID=UPI001E8D2C93|nr:uncharacterized protein C7974DRAFT_380839 [Boeremia exigua]KAH6613125.1 hypothetical protein C7974DRAFT_380839 [Boeremia exigua]
MVEEARERQAYFQAEEDRSRVELVQKTEQQRYIMEKRQQYMARLQNCCENSRSGLLLVANSLEQQESECRAAMATCQDAVHHSKIGQSLWRKIEQYNLREGQLAEEQDRRDRQEVHDRQQAALRRLDLPIVAATEPATLAIDHPLTSRTTQRSVENPTSIDARDVGYRAVGTRILTSMFCDSVDRRTIFQDDTCACCLSSILHLDGGNLVVTSCRHIFHEECLDMWVNDSAMLMSNCCPVCRFEMYQPRERCGSCTFEDAMQSKLRFICDVTLRSLASFCFLYYFGVP